MFLTYIVFSGHVFIFELCTMSAVPKISSFCILQKSINVSLIIEPLEISEANYNTAIELLKERYEKKETLYT